MSLERDRPQKRTGQALLLVVGIASIAVGCLNVPAAGPTDDSCLPEEPFTVTSAIGIDRDFARIGQWIDARTGDFTRRVVYELISQDGLVIPGTRFTGEDCSGTYVEGPDGIASFDAHEGCCAPGSRVANANGSIVVGDVLGTGVIEEGVLDAENYESDPITFDMAMTDAEHYWHLTVAAGERHAGQREGAFARIVPGNAPVGITILNDFTRISYVALTGWNETKQAPRGVQISAGGVVLDHLLLYDEGTGTGSMPGDPDGFGISLEQLDPSADDLPSISALVHHTIVLSTSRAAYIQRHGNSALTVVASLAGHCAFKVGSIDKDGACFAAESERMTVIGSLGFDSGGLVFRDDGEDTADGSFADATDDNASDDTSSTMIADLASRLEDSALASFDLHWSAPVIGGAAMNPVELGLIAPEDAVDIDGDPRPATGPWTLGPDQAP